MVLMKRAGLSPDASGCRFHVSVTVHEFGLAALRAFRQYQPRRKWFSLGLSAHLSCMARDPTVVIKSQSQGTSRANMAWWMFIVSW